MQVLRSAQHDISHSACFTYLRNAALACQEAVSSL